MYRDESAVLVSFSKLHVSILVCVIAVRQNSLLKQYQVFQPMCKEMKVWCTYTNIHLHIIFMYSVYVYSTKPIISLYMHVLGFTAEIIQTRVHQWLVNLHNEHKTCVPHASCMPYIRSNWKDM